MNTQTVQAVEAAEREKFEKAVRLGKIPHVPAHITWKNDECGKGYAQHFAQCAWSAWKAGRAELSRPQEVAEVTDAEINEAVRLTRLDGTIYLTPESLRKAVSFLPASRVPVALGATGERAGLFITNDSGLLEQIHPDDEKYVAGTELYLPGGAGGDVGALDHPDLVGGISLPATPAASVPAVGEVDRNHLADLRYIRMFLLGLSDEKHRSGDLKAAINGINYIIKRTEEAQPPAQDAAPAVAVEAVTRNICIESNEYQVTFLPDGDTEIRFVAPATPAVVQPTLVKVDEDAPPIEHDPILQLMGDRCQCERCRKDRASKAAGGGV